MLTIKLKKKHYTDLEGLLTEAKLVEGKNASPERLYVNKKTYALIQKELKKKLRKERPFASKRQLEYSVKMHLLNLGPNTNEGIKDGFALAFPRE